MTLRIKSIPAISLETIKMSYLDAETFAAVVECTPLISIDLIVRNPDGAVLLGKRINAPAQGYWFTPGGRIYKNEPVLDAYARIVRDETGLSRTIIDASFIGAFEHFYEDSIFGNHISTHYVVLAYELHADRDLSALPDTQHGKYRWALLNDLMSDDTVHTHVKQYFQRVANR